MRKGRKMKECMRELKAYQVAMQSLPDGCLAAEAEAEKQEKISVEVIGSQTGPMSCSEQTELFVRASGKKTGMVYTQKLDADASEVLAQALTNSEASAAEKAEPMATADYWEADETNAFDEIKVSDKTNTLDKATTSNGGEAKKLVSIETLKNKAKTLAKQLEERFGCVVRLDLSQTILTMGVVNTNNIEETASVQRFAAEVAANGYDGYACALTLDELSPEPFLHEFSNRKFLEVPAIPAEAGEYRTVLSSQAINNILITAWQMFTARRAQSGSTPFAGKENTKIFSDCITIRDYKGGADSANSVQCGFSWEMDCEGVPSRDVTLVENGVLKGWMHNLSTAEKAGARSTGNAGRKTLLSGNIHTDMAIMPKNFTIESGEASLEELLCACGDGVYVFENYDQFHALNVVSGDFAFPCKAVRIKDGKPVGIMEGLTMTGNVAELFSNVELVGSDRVINPLVMYDSYTVSGPAMLVGSLKVSG